MRLTHLAAAAATSLLLLSSVRADESWAGKLVAIKRAGVTARTEMDPSKRLTLTLAVYDVLQEKDGRLLIQQDDKKVWVEKADAVLSTDAIAYFTERIRTDPKNADLYARRGNVRFGQNVCLEALADYDEAIRLDPSVSDWWHQHAVLLWSSGHADRALSDLDRAIRLDPHDPRPLVTRGNFRLQSDPADPDGAIADIDAAIRLNPQEEFPYVLRVQAWLVGKRNPSRAMEEATKGIERFPDGAALYESRGWAAQSQGQFAKSIADLTAAIRIEPTPQRYVLRAGGLVGTKQFKSAAADLDECLKLDPANAAARLARAHCRIQLGDLAAALSDFEAVLKLDTKAPLSEGHWGVIEAAQLAQLGIGDVRERQGRYGDALRRFEALTKSQDSAAEGHARIGLLLATCPDASIRDGQKALEAARQACERGEWREPLGFLSLGAAYAETGAFDTAVFWVEKAIEDKRFAAEWGTTARAMLDSYRKRTVWHGHR